MKNTILALILSGALTSTSFAQINQRRENQQDRIASGIRSGSLTPRETAHLEGREAHLNREIRHDRFHDDGHLTTHERSQINRQQNGLSRAIYRDKHN